MQAQTAPAQAAPQPAIAPATAAAPPAGRATVTVINTDGTTQNLLIPLTRQDVADLRERREELSSQLTSAAGRRRRLAEDLRANPEGPARTGLEGRLAVLDNRLAQLEGDIASTGRQLSAAPQGLLASEGISMNRDIPENVMQISGVFTVFVLFPIALAFARRMWKGTGRQAVQAVFPQESAQRLERLEQGMEAIAIEIERVAEGQRFVTRLLAEAAPGGGIGSGSREPERLAERAASS
ncbi:MAG: hypothetical protein M3R07_03920 [Gemmatimonadota bacterium]|nr:hypothetical protein [Gemmatimonadota bacterium]